jgi:hypothetical protein
MVSFGPKGRPRRNDGIQIPDRKGQMFMPNIPLKWAAAATLLISSPAFAGTVFFDTFDTENGGATSLNHTGFANWNSTGAGFVDVVAMPDYGLTCAGGSGSCVDLDGSPGPGRITTKRNFTFNTGDLIRIDYDISGSQRGSDPDRYEVRFNFFQPTLLLDVGFNREQAIASPSPDLLIQ